MAYVVEYGRGIFVGICFYKSVPKLDDCLTDFPVNTCLVTAIEIERDVFE